MPLQRGWVIVQFSKDLLVKLRLRHFRKSEEGQALVLAGLALLVLMMMAGLGVDVAYLRYQKQQMQKAADAGALAAASALIYQGDYVNAAKNDTTANGFSPNQTVIGGLCTYSGTEICVAVNSPPVTPGDPFQGVAGYVEVIVAQARPTFFIPVVGISTLNVSSRAVATSASNGSGCLFALDPNDDANTLVIDSGVHVGSPSCAMYVESSNASALVENGTSGAIASYIGVVGTGAVGSQFGCEWNAPGAPCPQTVMAQFQDPLANVPAPTPASGCAHSTTINGVVNYPAGTYCSPGISVPSGTTATFGPGLITVEGTFNVSGTNTSLTSNPGGVLFYLTTGTTGYGGLNIAAGANIALNPQTTGAQAGILFFQDRGILPGGAPSFFNGNGSGSGQTNYSGVFYFLTTKLSYAGRVNPSLANSVILDAYKIEFTGNAQINSAVLPDNLSPLSTAILVE